MVANKNYVRANKRAAMQRAQDALIVQKEVNAIVEKEVAAIETQLVEYVEASRPQPAFDLNYYAKHIAIEIGAATDMEQLAFNKRLLAASYVFEAWKLCKAERKPWAKWHQEFLPQWSDTSVRDLLNVGKLPTHEEQVEALSSQKFKNLMANRRLRARQKAERLAAQEGGNVRLLSSKPTLPAPERLLLQIKALPAEDAGRVLAEAAPAQGFTLKKGTRTYFTWEMLLIDFQQLSRESQAEFLPRAMAIHQDAAIEGEATHAA